MPQVISLGLDGAAWHKLDRLVEDGRMPNLEGLIESGTRAPLRSVTPPVTCPAWRCSTTGKNPGKLGVFWWMNLDRDAGTITTPDSTSFESADLWEYLSQDGYKSAVVNVPMTYPPGKLDGLMVSGFGMPMDSTTGTEIPITYPPGYEQELRDDYDWQSTVDNIDTPAGLEQTYEVIRSRLELLIDLIEEDFDYIHLTVFYINMLQHKYGDSEETNRAWELIDEYLGQLPSEDTLLLIYSDHGHAEIENTFVVNQWLIENGYLSLSSESGESVIESVYTRLKSLGVSPKRLAASARSLLPESAYGRVIPSKYPIGSHDLPSRINWDDTTAVAFSQGPLYLNRDRLGSKYESVREELQQKLTSLTYQGDGVLDSVEQAEQVYEGPYVDQAPDLLLTSANGWEIYGGIVPSVFDSQPMSWTSGNDPEGMMLINGPSVASQTLSERSILDIAPTILAYLESPIPEDMDGTPLTQVFPDRDLSVDTRTPHEPSTRQYQTDSEELTQQLEDLGYLE
jgi:predicted AlkP superfamily phosphohydrolase/phosphomutase